MNRYKFLDENRQHLHTLDGKPLIGTTTALGVLAKNLTWWASELSAVECLEAGEHIPTIRKEYDEAVKSADKKKAIDLLQKKYPIFKKARFAHYDKKNETADTGTDMHAELENYVKMCIELSNGVPRAEGDPESMLPVDIFARWAVKNVKRFIASEGHGYNEKNWTGGILDCLYEDSEGRLVIMDFKSAKEAYMSMFFQCAGNDLQISESGVLDKDGNLLFDLKGRAVDYYAVFPFGNGNPEPQFHFDTAGAKEGFESAVKLHKLINK